MSATPCSRDTDPEAGTDRCLASQHNFFTILGVHLPVLCTLNAKRSSSDCLGRISYAPNVRRCLCVGFGNVGPRETMGASSPFRLPRWACNHIICLRKRYMELWLVGVQYLWVACPRQMRASTTSKAAVNMAPVAQGEMGRLSHQRLPF